MKKIILRKRKTLTEIDDKKTIEQVIHQLSEWNFCDALPQACQKAVRKQEEPSHQTESNPTNDDFTNLFPIEDLGSSDFHVSFTEPCGINGHPIKETELSSMNHHNLEKPRKPIIPKFFKQTNTSHKNLPTLHRKDIQQLIGSEENPLVQYPENSTKKT